MIVAEAAELLLELHPTNDYLSDMIRKTGDWFERPILDEIARRVKGGVIVDAGAHIGNHTVFMAEVVPHDTIHAFEPLLVNLELLRRNAAPYPDVTVWPVALSDQRGWVPMTEDPDNFGHTRIDSDSRMYYEAVALDALGDVIDNVSLLKIDVEGHEPQVLAGARETIERCHPLIVIEDWSGKGYDLPGYRVVAEWAEKHQTFMYEWEGP